MGHDHNSLVSHLTGYIHAMFKDIKWAYLSEDEWERDRSRLIHELAKKGSRILTLDLPALVKHFDKCLDRGMYTPSKGYLGKVPKKGVQVPVFLRDLYLQAFDRWGELRISPNTGAILAFRALGTGVKKLRLQFSERSLRGEINSFLEVERQLRPATLPWQDDVLIDPRCAGDVARLRHLMLSDTIYGESVGPVPIGSMAHPSKMGGLWEGNMEPWFTATGGNSLSGVLRTCQQVADRISAQFGDLHIEDITELPKHGPGAVSEGGKYLDKYNFQHWPKKLDSVFPFEYYADPSLGVGTISEGQPRPSSHEPGSRLIAVPKTQKGPRLIAAEPICHQWVQQLIRSQLETRLAKTSLRHCISFRDQSLSGKMALEASLTRSCGTIDLSSASDRLSCWLVERLFRGNLTLLERLHASRTRWLAYKDGLNSWNIQLKKFAPMGSAVTFPVQSIAYAYLAIGCVIHVSGQRVTRDSIEDAAAQIRIFGDDIIAPEACIGLLTQVLELCGLKVNADKTFSGPGGFRESCGVDGFQGDDVTPPYLLDPSQCTRLDQVGSLVAVRNNYYQKGFWHVAYWLDAQMARYQHLIPDLTPGSVGFGRASYVRGRPSGLIRFNRNLHRVEMKVVVLRRKTVLRSSTAAGNLLKWFNEKPLPEIHWSSGWVASESLRVGTGWAPLDTYSYEVIPHKVKKG